MAIVFEKVQRFAEVLDPTQGFQLLRQLVEHRKDPLTDDRTIVLPGRQNYMKHFFETDEKFLFDYAEETLAGCPFCRPSVETRTPKFPKELVDGGRIKVGEAVTFPSLFTHIEHNAVTALTRSHLLKLDEFEPEIFENGIKASLEYVRRVYSRDKDVRYAALVVNYLPPAGSTVVHPHMQALASSVPIRKIDGLLNCSRVYFEKSRSNYWLDLLEAEKRIRERYIGRVGASEWTVPFCPRGFYEVNAVIPEKTNLLELSEDDISDIAKGLSKTLSFYKANNIWSFNIAIYSGLLGVKSEYFSINLKIAARYAFRSRSVNDRWSLPFLLEEIIV